MVKLSTNVFTNGRHDEKLICFPSLKAGTSCIPSGDSKGVLLYSADNVMFEEHVFNFLK